MLRRAARIKKLKKPGCLESGNMAVGVVCVAGNLNEAPSLPLHCAVVLLCVCVCVDDVTRLV